MKKLFFFALFVPFFLVSCTKTLSYVGTYALEDSIQTVSMAIDSIGHIITLYPPASSYTDATPEIDSAVTYGNTHPGAWLSVVMPGNFHLYTAPVAANLKNGIYGQVTFDLEALNDAKDAPVGSTTNFILHYSDDFGFGIQEGKSCVIKGIVFQGMFTLMNSLSMVQIDTMPYAAMTDGVCRNNQVSPYAGIVIDPFSDPSHYDGVTLQMYPRLTQYYASGMGTAGSTDIQIIDCQIQKFVVGMMISPAWQGNGDEIQLLNDQIDQDRSSYASASAQNKQCTVTGLMEWGQVYDVFDLGHYGYGHTDGTNPPQIYGMSVAGNTNQLFDLQDPAFPLIAYGIVAENVWRIGRVFSFGGNLISGSQIDLQQNLPGVPSPDMIWWGPYTDWEGCMIRVYNGSQIGGRIVMNAQANTFNGGSFSDPPICVNKEVALGYSPNAPTIFSNVFAQYSNIVLNGNGWDSTINIGNNISMTVNTGTFVGSFVVPTAVGASIQVGDEITTHHTFSEDQLTGYQSYEYPVGCTTAIHYGAVQDTVTVRNAGLGIYTGTVLNLYDQKLKVGY